MQKDASIINQNIKGNAKGRMMPKSKMQSTGKHTCGFGPFWEPHKHSPRTVGVTGIRIIPGHRYISQIITT